MKIKRNYKNKLKTNCQSIMHYDITVTQEIAVGENKNHLTEIHLNKLQIITNIITGVNISKDYKPVYLIRNSNSPEEIYKLKRFR